MTSPLHSLILREAKQHPLTIARFMEWALQHPEYGYYRRHDPLGLEGDFVTAPEVSQMFGELLGLWCVDYWQQMGQPAPFALVELGPGRGTLMADALRAARMVPEFIAAVQLWLLESNADLRVRQADLLAASEPQWLADLGALPEMPTIILANEFFDALPIRQMRRTDSGWVERCIGALDEQLGWVDVAAPVALVAQLSAEQRALPVGATAEISPAAREIMQTCVRHIVARGGALLALDYGYTEPDGQPSFQAVARHSYSNPLLAPGEVDLTAHVDFTALATCAALAGGKIWPVREQGAFLAHLGLHQRAAQLAAGGDVQTKAAVAAAVERLSHPATMGSLFKVLCVTADFGMIPAGGAP